MDFGRKNYDFFANGARNMAFTINPFKLGGCMTSNPYTKSDIDRLRLKQNGWLVFLQTFQISVYDYIGIFILISFIEMCSEAWLTILQHWFKYWFVAISAPSHNLNQLCSVNWRIYKRLSALVNYHCVLQIGLHKWK